MGKKFNVSEKPFVLASMASCTLAIRSILHLIALFQTLGRPKKKRKDSNTSSNSSYSMRRSLSDPLIALPIDPNNLKPGDKEVNG